jgi:hypothetical protein
VPSRPFTAGCFGAAGGGELPPPHDIDAIAASATVAPARIVTSAA